MTDSHPQQSSFLALPSPPAEREANLYYAGLPSAPVLVARSDTTTWKEPTGPWQRLPDKELRPAGGHPIQEIWESVLAPKLLGLLDSMKVKWTSTDIVRFGYVGESFAPIVLWIGVMPETLSGHDGVSVVLKCQQLLQEYGVADVNVEIRESVVTRSVGPKLLSKPYDSDPIADVCELLTTTLGLPICAESTPWSEGTGGFFITERSNPNQLLLVTARHVVFPPDRNKNANNNMHYSRKNNSQRKHNVLLFGDAGFNGYLESIRAQIRTKAYNIQSCEKRLDAVEGNDHPKAIVEREDAQALLANAKKANMGLESHYKDVLAHWSNPKDRILGHVILSPPINMGVGNEGYTEDWAVIEVDASKINASNFIGNAIDLGMATGGREFTSWMHPNLKNNKSFEFPYDHILRINGIISDDQLRSPKTVDHDNDPCLMVIKRGRTTGLTIGRATGFASYIRIYDGFDAKTSKEWAIIPRTSKPVAFSEDGDSGSVIVDGLGRIGGLLTGGTRHRRDSSDITYATPIDFLLKRMQNYGLSKPCVNPVLAA